MGKASRTTSMIRLADCWPRRRLRSPLLPELNKFLLRDKIQADEKDSQDKAGAIDVYLGNLFGIT